MPHKTPRKSSHKASSHTILNLDAVSKGCEMVGSGSMEASSPRRLESSVEVDRRGYHGVGSGRGLGTR
ncbi:hypothetical protein BN1708_012512 [Verticillium longisporum]|uniref:Uncharacterized protein n=1 Tax=Verticillium longisporum TaxID=100787 RepID=A0A0G4LAU6_VERLO|nr:hypothetical protein BN1708_012512 [Verticillium longisporum]